jgi:hypothetical protein
MHETTTPQSGLARALAGLPAISQLDAALKAGRLPVNSESLAMLDSGLIRIKYAPTESEGVEPELVKAFKTLADAADVIIRVAFQTDTGRKAVSIMEEGLCMSVR